jgi:hypothetical protein
MLASAAYAIALCAVASVGIPMHAHGADPAARELPTRELAARIDRHFAQLWQRAELQPAVANDATFLRRVYLDLPGRIPTVSEARTFLADSDPNKRAKLVDRLLDHPATARHLAQFWRRSWLPQADNQQLSQLAEELERWLAASLAADVSYQHLAQQLLLADVQQYRSEGDQELLPNSAFLVAAEFRPENLAANACRSFLGINLDCAQCHDHPFSRWKREQFWQTAAFFVRPTRAAEELDANHYRVTIPETELVMRARLLNGEAPAWPQKLDIDSGRRVLVDWIAASDNPFFARNAVNRLWSHFFGQGLIEPLDDLSAEGPHLHGPLLDELARQFVEANWQWKPLARAMVLSRVYQLDSVPANELCRQAPPEFYPQMPIRSLSGEQLYHSLLIATGKPLAADDTAGGDEARQAFVQKFGSNRSARSERSILQSLLLMNGPLTQELTAADAPLLSSVARSPFWTHEKKVEVLFLAAYSRLPHKAEHALAAKTIADSDQRDQALSDLLWALLNSAEFNCNH